MPVPPPAVARALALLLPALLAIPAVGSGYRPAEVGPPEPLREFRGAWVATVHNIDWPSRRGLPSDRQKKELADMLDLAVRLRMNAVFFQVRPACDALYESKLEPWSELLRGKQGE